MKNFTKKIMLIICLYITLFAAFLYYGYSPVSNRYKKNKSDEAEKKELIVKNNDKIASLQKIESNSADFDKIFTDVNNFLPDSLGVSDFMVQIEGLAKDSGVVIDSFSVEEQKASTTTKSKTDNGTKFSMVFKAPYSTVISLISKMETLARLNSISTVNMTGNGDKISVNLSGKIYYGK